MPGILPFRLRCHKKCCQSSLWTSNNALVDFDLVKLTSQLQLLVPLTDVRIEGVIEAGTAITDVQLVYKNACSDKSIECTFDFSIDKQSLISRMTAEIDEKLVELVVKEKELAKETYDDAVASGKFAAFSELKSQREDRFVRVVLGNLQPN